MAPASRDFIPLKKTLDTVLQDLKRRSFRVQDQTQGGFQVRRAAPTKAKGSNAKFSRANCARRWRATSASKGGLQVEKESTLHGTPKPEEMMH